MDLCKGRLGMKWLRKYDAELILLVTFGSVLTIVFGLYLHTDAALKLEQRLRAECVADGKKEYECEAMLVASNPSTQNDELVVRFFNA